MVAHLVKASTPGTAIEFKLRSSKKFMQLGLVIDCTLSPRFFVQLPQNDDTRFNQEDQGFR
jgi:hypothetical protein